MKYQHGICVAILNEYQDINLDRLLTCTFLYCNLFAVTIKSGYNQEIF